jgi:hypothetical protein
MHVDRPFWFGIRPLAARMHGMKMKKPFMAVLSP